MVGQKTATPTIACTVGTARGHMTSPNNTRGETCIVSAERIFISGGRQRLMCCVHSAQASAGLLWALPLAHTPQTACMGAASSAHTTDSVCIAGEFYLPYFQGRSWSNDAYCSSGEYLGASSCPSPRNALQARSGSSSSRGYASGFRSNPRD